MNKKRAKGLICDSCYHRIDCNVLPYQVDFCVLYKKEIEIESIKDQDTNIQNTIEFNNEDLKLLYKKKR
jgi:Fe-S-cluster-containing dehydrogenase component